jgi:hypothetical protein
VRLAAAIAVIAVAWSAALYVHQRRVTFHPSFVCKTLPTGAYAMTADAFDGFALHRGANPDTGNCPAGEALYSDHLYESGTKSHPSWEDPAALLFVIGGVAAAVALVATGRQRQGDDSGVGREALS